MADTPKSVGIWIRVSTEDQARGDSPEHHEKRARYYAEGRGWEVKEVYHLEAVSGKTVMGQPETQRMLNDVRGGQISGLIFSKLARLARNTKELLEFSEIFRECNADLISLQESIDTTTPTGRLFYTMIAAMAQWEREEIADRVAASVAIRAKLGKPLGGAAPFGYQWQDKKLIPNPKEAPVCRLIYELFLEHHRKRTVARILNERGYRTRSDAKFSYTTISRLLHDPTTKGLHRLNYTRNLSGNKGRVVLKPKEEWTYLSVEPIIPEELWNGCHGIMDEQDKCRKPVARRPVHLFAGLIFCRCGGKMYVPSNSPKYTCRECRNKISVDDIETIFHEQLKKFVFSPDEIMDYLSQADEVIQNKQQQFDTLMAEAKILKPKIDGVFDLYLDGKITKAEFSNRYQPLKTRADQIDDQIPQLQAEIDFLKIQHLSSDQILQEAQNLSRLWPLMTTEEKREIAENILEKIVVGDKEININLAYLPHSSEIMATRQRSQSALRWMSSLISGGSRAGRRRAVWCGCHDPNAFSTPTTRRMSFLMGRATCVRFTSIGGARMR